MMTQKNGYSVTDVKFIPTWNGAEYPATSVKTTVKWKNRGGDCSVSVHILNFELFLQITKIVTKSTQEGTEISASALFFYVAGVEISGFLSTFARNFRV